MYLHNKQIEEKICLSSIKYFSHQQIFSSYAHGHNFEEEANVHDLPYGYELGDDPFEA